MSTELERLKAWMAAEGYDAVSLQRTIGMGFSIKFMMDGKRGIYEGFLYRFRDTFGDVTFANIFSDRRSDYLAQYAAQQAVLAAIAKGQLPPAKTHKCYGCDKQATEYHHESYAKEDRLNVVPLCRSCHRCHHSGKRRLTFGVVPTGVGVVRIAIAGL